MQNDRRDRFEALYYDHREAVWRYARRRADEQGAADVFSEVFMIAWRRLERVPDEPDDALPWLLACTRKVLWHQQRAERRRFRLIARLASSAPVVVEQPERPTGELSRALAKLSERDRDALLLTAWDGLTSEQAAEVLGCSPQAFRARARRARRRLAHELTTLGQETRLPNSTQVCE